jgi:hypothetical protein
MLPRRRRRSARTPKAIAVTVTTARAAQDCQSSCMPHSRAAAGAWQARCHKSIMSGRNRAVTRRKIPGCGAYLLRHELCCLSPSRRPRLVRHAGHEKINILDLMQKGGVEYHINPDQDFADPAERDLPDQGRGASHQRSRLWLHGHQGELQGLPSRGGLQMGSEDLGQTRRPLARQRHPRPLLRPARRLFGTPGWPASRRRSLRAASATSWCSLPSWQTAPNSSPAVRRVRAGPGQGEALEKGAPRQVVTKGRINWEKRHEDWADKFNIRHPDDPDSPVGEWNRMEVIAKGDTLQYFVNGRLVNEAFDCKPAEGRICIQTEGAEMIVRKYELHPLGGFTEKWSAIQASGGSDIRCAKGRRRRSRQRNRANRFSSTAIMKCSSSPPSRSCWTPWKSPGMRRAASSSPRCATTRSVRPTRAIPGCPASPAHR